jgi:hypothetical protein
MYYFFMLLYFSVVNLVTGLRQSLLLPGALCFSIYFLLIWQRLVPRSGRASSARSSLGRHSSADCDDRLCYSLVLLILIMYYIKWYGMKRS